MKAIIFDFDGVLVDSMPDHSEAWKQTFASVGISIERKDIYELEGSNQRQIVDIMFRRNGRIPTEEEIDDLARKKIEIFDRIQKVRIFDGMKELLLSLTGKYKLAVVSGSNRKFIEDTVKNSFPDTFQVIISGEDVEKSKPSPEPYLKAVEKLGVGAKDCLVIENAPLGIRSAKSAGLRCIGVPSYLDRESLKEADVISTHKELARYIQEWEESIS